jgi:murein DD-endopeptidase MepM/ murein hydrolase activator NlpD
MELKRQIGWIARLTAALLILPAFSGCSSISPGSSARHGLFDDLAEGGSRSPASLHHGHQAYKDGRVTAQNIPARPTGNPVIDKPRSKKERAEKAAALEASPKAMELKSAGLRWPLLRVEVTSPFGSRGREFHEGIDLRAKVGTPIYAAQAGTVIYADSKIRGYGRMIVIKHREGLATVYAHASRLLVRKGQKVNAGQKIAISGKSGHATGPHLHFEVRSGVVAVNPYEFLPKHEVARIEEPTPAPENRPQQSRTTIRTHARGNVHARKNPDTHATMLALGSNSETSTSH